MKNKNLHYSKQPSYTCENMIQGKHEIYDNQPNKKVSSEEFNEAERNFPMSPTPKKYARVERGRGYCNNHKDEGWKDREKSSDFILETDDDAVHIKYEIPDDGDKWHFNDEISSFQNGASNSYTRSLHSSNVYFLHGKSVESSSTLGYPNQCQRRHSSLMVEHTSTSRCVQEDATPDSSTDTREHLSRGVPRNVSSVTHMDATPSFSLSTTAPSTKDVSTLCQVCGDLTAGFYCGAYICEACKKFFIRACKLEQPRYVCLRSKHCVITKESRVHCQFCRYQKCLELNMYYPKDGQKKANKTGVQEIPCRVCSAPSSGFHFGALTCEGCKGFFRRMVKEREAYTYKCSRAGNCEVNATTRNMCKACRYNKCLQIGMSVEGSRIGRQPNAVKHAISIEARKQAALKIEPGVDNGSSPSHLNFDSVIIDPCLPGDVDDSLQSIDLTQVSSSVDIVKPAPIKMEEIKAEPEPTLPLCQVNQVLTGIEQHMTSPGPVDHSAIFRHQMPSSSPNHHKHIHKPYTSALSPSSVPRNSKPQIFGRPHFDVYDSSSDNQPQDLSIDLSKPQTTASSVGHTTSHDFSVSGTQHLSFPLTRPPSFIPPHDVNNLSSQSPHPPSSSYNNYPTDYIHQGQQNIHGPYFMYSFVDQDKHCKPAYHLQESYGENTSYPSNLYSGRLIPKQETFNNRMYNHNYQPEALGSQFSSPFPDCNRPPYEHFEQHPAPYFHNLRSQPLQQTQPILSRQNRVDEICMSHPTDRQEYTSQLVSADMYRGSHNLHSFSNRCHQSPEPQNLKISQQEWSSSRPSTLSQSSCHDLPHVHFPGIAVTVAPCPQKEPTPPPPQRRDIQEPSIPATTSVKVKTAGNQACFNVSNDELNGILLDAAKNLAHFCTVNRAKSDLFEADRFKDVDSTWEKMMEHFNFHAKCIVRFAKRIPGFRSLKIDDQVLLLRMATYSLVILNHSRAYEPDTGFYNYFNFTRNEIEMIKELFPEFDVIHVHYKHAGIMAQRHVLTDMEYAYMSCMLLLNDEHTGLENTDRTKELKERYMNAFQDYETEHFPEGSIRFGEMLLCLSEFSQFSMQHNIAVGLVITKNPQLHIPQLYAEMYTPSNSALDNSDSVNDDDNTDVGELMEPPTVGSVK